MKKSIVVLAAAGVAGIGITGLAIMHIRALAQENEAIARFVDEVAAQSAVAQPKLSDKMSRRDLPGLIAALSQQAGTTEQAYSWLCSALPDCVTARLPGIYPSAMIRLNAAAVVGRWGPSARVAVPQLVRLLRDDVADSNAALSLGQIGPDAKEAMPDLIIAVEEHRPGAATALGMIGPAAQSAQASLQAAAVNAPEWQRHEINGALRRMGESLSAQN